MGYKTPNDHQPARRLRGEVARARFRLALDILARRPVPPAVFVKHQIITRENLDHFYANDALMGVKTYARF